jgi:pantoate--beta-alanine ligase
MPKGTKVGFVPTMGALHKGHQSLIETSIVGQDKTIVSIFVNPTQFNDSSDFQNYPIDIEKDMALLKAWMVDVVFLPKVQEMYPEGFDTWIQVGQVGERYCGHSRPGHFKGVTTIVHKLLNIIRPDVMYLGEKDFQQAFIIEKMLRETHSDVRIERCPTVREADGLAMSSRNALLSDTERKVALCIHEAMTLAKWLVDHDITDTKVIKNKMILLIAANEVVLDYIGFVNSCTFDDEDIVSPDTRVLIALQVGGVRLIDNASLK